MARRLAAVARWLVPVVLIALVVRYVDLRPVALRLRHLDARWAAIALALTPPLYALYALGWSFTARRLGAPLTFRRAFAEYYVSTLLNQLLPLGIAGDVARRAEGSAAGCRLQQPGKRSDARRRGDGSPSNRPDAVAVRERADAAAGQHDAHDDGARGESRRR